jgi:hypothetical protein
VALVVFTSGIVDWSPRSGRVQLLMLGAGVGVEHTVGVLRHQDPHPARVIGYVPSVRVALLRGGPCVRVARVFGCGPCVGWVWVGVLGSCHWCACLCGCVCWWVGLLFEIWIVDASIFVVLLCLFDVCW